MSNEPKPVKVRLLTNPVLAGATAASPKLARRGKKLLITNPMKMEISRFRRRFLNVTDSPNLNRTLVAMVCLVYLSVVAMLVWWRKDIEIGMVLIVQAITMILMSIGTAHSAIAAEKERKSWDLLQAAPVSYDEIVVGKFLGVLGLVFAFAAAFLPAALISVFFASASLAQAFFGELLCISAGTMVGAYTLWLSARCKTANAALVGAVSTVVGVLVILPMLLAWLVDLATGTAIQDLLFFWHPIYVLYKMMIGDGWLGIWQTVGYLVLTLFFLSRASRAVAKSAGKE